MSVIYQKIYNVEKDDSFDYGKRVKEDYSNYISF